MAGWLTTHLSVVCQAQNTYLFRLYTDLNWNAFLFVFFIRRQCINRLCLTVANHQFKHSKLLPALLLRRKYHESDIFMSRSTAFKACKSLQSIWKLVDMRYHGASLCIHRYKSHICYDCVYNETILCSCYFNENKYASIAVHSWLSACVLSCIIQLDCVCACMYS